MNAVAAAMHSHRDIAMDLLKNDDGRRERLFDLIYDLLREPEIGRELLERGGER